MRRRRVVLLLCRRRRRRRRAQPGKHETRGSDFTAETDGRTDGPDDDDGAHVGTAGWLPPLSLFSRRVARGAAQRNQRWAIIFDASVGEENQTTGVTRCKRHLDRQIDANTSLAAHNY